MDDDRDDRGILALVFAAQALTLLDVMMMVVGAPRIGKDLGASTGQLQLLFAAYSVAIAVSMVPSGLLGDVVGRDRMLRGGVLLTLVASLGATFAPNVELLIACRAASGIAAAAIGPQVIGLMRTEIAESRRPHAFSVWGLGSSVGAIAGHLGGGLLLRLDPFGLNWRPGFACVAIVAMVVVGMVWRVVPPASVHAHRSFDVVGIVLLAGGLSSLIYPLAMGRTSGWPAWMFVLFALSLILLVAFARWEWRVAAAGGEPVVDLRLLLGGTFRAGLICAVVTVGSASTFPFMFTVFVQIGLGADPFIAGALFCALSAGFIVASHVAKRRPTLDTAFVGCLIGVAAYVIFAAQCLLLGDDISIPQLIPAVVLTGVCQGAVIPQILRFAMHDVPAAVVSRGAAALSTAQQVAGAIGVALMGTVLFWRVGDGTDTAAYVTAFGQTMFFALLPVQLAGAWFTWRLRAAVARSLSNADGETPVIPATTAPAS